MVHTITWLKPLRPSAALTCGCLSIGALPFAVQRYTGYLSEPEQPLTVCIATQLERPPPSTHDPQWCLPAAACQLELLFSVQKYRDYFVLPRNGHSCDLVRASATLCHTLLQPHYLFALLIFC